MNLLEIWHRNDVIMLEMSEPSMGEAFAGGDRHRQTKASEYIYSYTLADTPQEQTLLRRISEILFPAGPRNRNELNDVEIVFNAAKYHRILITNDGGSRTQPGGILGNANALAELGITVVTDSEAVEMVRRAIAKRDRRSLHAHKVRGAELPEWVGKD